MTQNEHLEWLLHLMKDNPEAWKQHCWRRAKELAQQPDLAELPALLQAAMTSSVSAASGTPEGKCSTVEL